MFPNMPEDTAALLRHEADQKRIRKLARQYGFNVTSRKGRWYLAHPKYLSPDTGMSDEGAILWLLDAIADLKGEKR